MQRFKNILLVTNGESEEAPLFDMALKLAGKNKAALSLAGTVGRLPRSYTLFEAEGIAEAAGLEMQRKLDELVANAIREGVRVRLTLLSGPPFLEIIRSVLRHGHDLVMLAAEGKQGLREMIFGTTTMHLMRKCPCPVWVVKPDQELHFGRVLAAIDADANEEENPELNRKILELATSLTRREAAEFHLIYVWSLFGENALRSRLPPSDFTRFFQQEADMHRKWLDNLLQQYTFESEPKVHFLKGEPAAVIAEVAKAETIDVIVMGTVGRIGIPGFFIGNTAENVLQPVDCSVLGVKPDGFVTPVTLDGDESRPR